MAGYESPSHGYGDPHGYGSTAHGYQPSTYYSPFPDATRLLDGPGSSAYVGAPHSATYAYEGPNGAVSTSSFSFSAGYFEEAGSYQYKGAGGSFDTNYGYKDYAVRTPGGYEGTHGYYTTYPVAAGQHGTGSYYDVSTKTYAGTATYSTFTSESSYTTSYGYSVSSYARETSESVGGHEVAGSAYSYQVTAVSDAYGDTTYTTHGATF